MQRKKSIPSKVTIKSIRDSMAEKLGDKRIYLVNAFNLDHEGLDGRNLYYYMIEKIANERVTIINQENIYEANTDTHGINESKTAG